MTRRSLPMNPAMNLKEPCNFLCDRWLRQSVEMTMIPASGNPAGPEKPLVPVPLRAAFPAAIPSPARDEKDDDRQCDGPLSELSSH
jgi:hypothetical protein